MKNGVDFLKTGFRESFCYHLGYAVRMLLNKNLLLANSIRYPEHILFGEDTVIFPKSILYASKVMSINEICYNYRINPESISSRYDVNIAAELIYQHSLLTGIDLLKFSKEAKRTDIEISVALRQRAISHYINGFIIKLLRTSQQEKRNFYKIINNNRDILETVKPYFTKLNALICNRYIGYTLLSVISIAYKFKYKK